MKKRFKVIIGVSAFLTAAGLFASLVFCALSAFPELLETEAQNHEVANDVVDAPVNHTLKAEPENDEISYVGLGNGDTFIPSNYDQHETPAIAQTSPKGNEKAITEIHTAIEEIKAIRGKEHFSGFYEYRDETVVTKEKVNAIYIEKDEDNNKILECTLLVLVIVQALGFVILQSKNKEPQIECLENRENHQD